MCVCVVYRYVCECVCIPVHGCVFACVHVWMSEEHLLRVHVEARGKCGVSFSFTPPFSDIRFLTELGLAVSARLADQCVRKSCLSSRPSSGSQMCTTTSSFSVDTENLNSGLLAYAVVTLPMGPFLQPQDFFFYWPWTYIHFPSVTNFRIAQKTFEDLKRSPFAFCYEVQKERKVGKKRGSW